MKLMRDFRPELAQQVHSHIGTDAEASSLRPGAKAALVAGVIEIAQRLGAGCAQPFRVVEHQMPGVAVSNKHMAHRMEKTALHTALSQTVIARVLAEDRGIKKSIGEISLDAIG